jgi:hypothetical protein
MPPSRTSSLSIHRVPSWKQEPLRSLHCSCPRKPTNGRRSSNSLASRQSRLTDCGVGPKFHKSRSAQALPRPGRGKAKEYVRRSASAVVSTADKEAHHGPHDVPRSTGQRGTTNGARAATLLRHKGSWLRRRFHQLRTCRRVSPRPSWADTLSARIRDERNFIENCQHQEGGTREQ